MNRSEDEKPAYEMDTEEFVKSTAHWSIKTVGIYIRLLMEEFVRGTLPTDIADIARILRCTPEEAKAGIVKLESYGVCKNMNFRDHLPAFIWRYDQG